jgi:hypothetical protein
VSKLAVALRARVAEAPGEGGLAPLRGALAGAGAGAREEVMVDFLEDDLRAAEDAVQELKSYLASIEAALQGGGARRRELLALAFRERPLQSLDELQGTIAGVRRRLAVVAARLPA